MTSEIELEISEISNRLKKLHSLVTEALSQAMKAFEDLDEQVALDAVSISAEIDQIYHTIEDMIFKTISTYQPSGPALRQFIAYNQASISLQRVGRYSNKINEIVLRSQDLEHFKELESLPYLAELAEAALDVAMRALLEADLSEINELEKLEAQSDNETAEMFEEIAEYLSRRRDISEIAMYYIIVGRYFERAADQAIAIAEAASYMITGERTILGLAYKEEPQSLLD